MNTQGTFSPWIKAFFISLFCHGLFMLILFCFQTASPDSQPETTELYEMDLTQSLVGPSEPAADNPSDSDLPEDEQTLATTPSPTAQDEKKPPESEQNLNPPSQNSLPNLKQRKEPTNKKKNLQPPTVQKTVSPIYPENILKTKQAFRITLILNISESGQPVFSTITVAVSSGSKELDDAAITALKQWVFNPAFNRDIGKQIPWDTTIDFNYPEENLSQQSL